MTNPRVKFIHRGSVPPIGYVYEIVHEGVSYTFQSPSFSALLRQLKQWHMKKGLEWPGDQEMDARVQEFICKYVPPGFCTGGADMPEVPFLSAPMIRDGTRLFLKKMSKGKKALVPPEEAERRARICANCPKNLHGMCTSCAGNEFQDIFQWFIRRGRRTSVDSVLDTCYTCGCLLKAKVHVDISVLETLEKHSYPENCWLHGTSCHVDRPKETR